MVKKVGWFLEGEGKVQTTCTTAFTCFTLPRDIGTYRCSGKFFRPLSERTGNSRKRTQTSDGWRQGDNNTVCL